MEKHTFVTASHLTEMDIETLRVREQELRLKEEAAARAVQQSADEVNAALKVLDEYVKDVEKTLAASWFVTSRDDVVQHLATELGADTLSSNFYDGLSRKIANTFLELNTNGLGKTKSDFMQKFLAEVCPMIAKYFVDHAIGALKAWGNQPPGIWKRFVDDIDYLSREIQEIGARHGQMPPLIIKDPISAVPIPVESLLDVSAIQEQIQGSLGWLEAVAEELHKVFFSQLLNVVITRLGFGRSEDQLLADCAGAIRPKLEEFFCGVTVRSILERGLQPVFLEAHQRALNAIDSARADYRARIQARCDELVKLHRALDEELRRIAEENHKLRVSSGNKK